MKTDQIDDSSAPLIEHLAELRNRLIWSVLAFLVAMLLCFAVAEPILDFLLTPIEEAMRALGNPNPTMQYTAPQEYFFTMVHISVVAGLMLSFPVIGYQLWRFIAPGLYRSEKQAFLPFLIASPVLFLCGAAFAHYVVTPIAMQFFLGFADSSSLLTALLPGLKDAPVSEITQPETAKGIDIVFQGKVNETLDISLKLILAFGFCFQLAGAADADGQGRACHLARAGGHAEICHRADPDPGRVSDPARCAEPDHPLSLPSTRFTKCRSS
jgi:sec-independent protein translocase protein TatC